MVLYVYRATKAGMAGGNLSSGTEILSLLNHLGRHDEDFDPVGVHHDMYSVV